MRKVRKVRKVARYGAFHLRKSCGKLRKKCGGSELPQKIRNLPQTFRNLKPAWVESFRRIRRFRSIPDTQIHQLGQGATAMTNQQPEQIPNPNTRDRPKGSHNRRTIVREALQQAYPNAVAQQATAEDLKAKALLARAG